MSGLKYLQIFMMLSSLDSYYLLKILPFELYFLGIVVSLSDAKNDIFW